MSTGEAIANPRFFREDQATLARASRKLSRAAKGSKEREKKRNIVARIHERIGNRRKNFIEQEASKLVVRFGLLAIEALVVGTLVKKTHLSKSDCRCLVVDVLHPSSRAKAEEAGRQVVRVNPAYTSQTCSACGHRQPMPLSVRVYECSHCGLVIHRDHNGSRNILADALQACGRAG
ncbi:RNA-guided endonuclease InsQ/TnpB family protein [Ktedonobacter racemifer]|uniref:RNA-guided endonuclease InsQ/TnpB family protein n=1 Tax=Ktedonobacter racemifer TaxID=363277 RepID=UPI0002EB4025|nr:RNA-guided endonuclease TnpB family protein [Ktedonobacter racemifer]